MTAGVIGPEHPHFRTAGTSEALKQAREDIKRLEADKALISQTASDYLHEIERLRAALQLSQSQNYCTMCGTILEKDGADGQAAPAAEGEEEVMGDAALTKFCAEVVISNHVEGVMVSVKAGRWVYPIVFPWGSQGELWAKRLCEAKEEGGK